MMSSICIEYDEQQVYLLLGMRCKSALKKKKVHLLLLGMRSKSALRHHSRQRTQVYLVREHRCTYRCTHRCPF
jgi:hypothetical protein